MTQPGHDFRTLSIGIAHILFTYLCFTILVTLSRYAIPSSSLSMVLFFQNFISLILILPWLCRYGKRGLYAPEWRLIIVRSVFGIIGFALLFTSAQKISLVGAILLNNAAPIYVPIVLWLWLRKKIDHRLWVGIILGFMGVILVLRPGGEVLEQALSIQDNQYLAIFSGVCLAITMISMRQLLRTERVFTVLFYYYLIATVITFPFALRTWVPLQPDVLWLFFVIGLLAFVGQFAFLKAFRYGQATQLSPFAYAAVIYGGLIDWIFYGRLPHFYFVIGIILIILGGTWTILFTRPAKVKVTFKK